MDRHLIGSRNFDLPPKCISLDRDLQLDVPDSQSQVAAMVHHPRHFGYNKDYRVLLDCTSRYHGNGGPMLSLAFDRGPRPD